MRISAATRHTILGLALLLAALLAMPAAPARAAPAEADLVLTMTADVDTATVDDAVEFTLHVHNAGPDTAPHVVVTDPLPFDFELLAVGSSQGDCTAGAGQVVVCDLGAVAAGGEADVALIAIAAQAGVQENTATVGDDGVVDPPENNTASATVTVVNQQADLGITMSAAPTVTLGGEIAYAVTVSNGGPFWQGDVAVSDWLSSRLSPVSAAASRGSCAIVDRHVSCGLGRMEAGESATVTIVARANLIGTTSNAVSVSGLADGTDDPNEANDQATVPVTVLGLTSPLPLTPIIWRPPVTSSPTPPATTRAYTTSATIRRSGRRISGRVTSDAAECLAHRTVVLRRAGGGTTRYGQAVTKADGTFAITTKRRLRGRVYVMVATSYGRSGRCRSGRSRAR